jgi:hypothetical protein
VLTEPDTIEEGHHDQFVANFSNSGGFQLEHGWYAIKNPSQLQLEAGMGKWAAWSVLLESRYLFCLSAAGGSLLLPRLSYYLTCP